MKTFYKKLFLGSVSCAALFLGLLLGVLAYERANYEKAITLPKDCKSYICLSDSMTVYALDPTYWPELVNLSSEASSLDVQLMKLLDIVEKNPNKIEAVLLDISLLRFFGEEERLTVNGEQEGSKFFPLYLWHHDMGAIIGKCDIGFGISANYVRWRIKQFTKDDQVSPLAQGYIYRISSVFPKGYEQEKKSAQSYADICNKEQFNPKGAWSVKIIRTMIETCKRNNVKVVILTMPLHHLITERLSPGAHVKYENTLNNICEEYDIEWVNYLQCDLPDDCFININHLNNNGGKIVTQKLAEHFIHP